MGRALLLLPLAILSGCATSPASFYAAPARQDTTSLCRAVAETADPSFKNDVAIELERRGQTPDGCRSKVSTQNAVIAGVVVAGAAVAVGVAAHNGVFDGMGGGRYEDYVWDRFYGRYGVMWRCRSTMTGQFVPDYMCAGQPMVDNYL